MRMPRKQRKNHPKMKQKRRKVKKEKKASLV